MVDTDCPGERTPLLHNGTTSQSSVPDSYGSEKNVNCRKKSYALESSPEAFHQIPEGEVCSYSFITAICYIVLGFVELNYGGHGAWLDGQQLCENASK